MKCVSRVLILGLLALAALPSRAAAQATAVTGHVEGVVTDPSGAVLPGAVVIARNAQTGFSRITVTDGQGRYRLSLLPLGGYTIAADLQGFARAERTGLGLSVGLTLTLNFKLAVATLAETTTVVGDPAIETTRTLPAATIDERAIDTLPINGRRFQDFMLLTPGAVVEGQRGGTSVNGQRGINSAFNVDGTSWDNPFFGGIKGGERSNEAYTISQEAIKEFAVNNAGYSAEFGRSAGGVMNAVTKSGTNIFSGSGFWFFRNEGLVADDSFGRPPTDFSQHQFGGTAGGPIVRNRTHFFVAYDQQVKESPFTVEFSGPDPTAAGIPGFDGKAGTFSQTNDIWTLFTRVDHQFNANNTFWVRYNYSFNEGINGLSTPVSNLAVDNSGLEKDETNTVVASWSSILSPTTLNELRFQYGREDRPREPNTNDVAISVTGLGVTGRRTFLPALQNDERFQLVNNFTWTAGHHSVRAGTDLNFLHVQQPFFLSRAGGEYRFSSIDDYMETVQTGVQQWRDFRQGFGRAGVDFWQQEYAFYIQDTWSVTPALTLSYGLRYDAQLNPTPDAPNPALPESAQIPSDKNNWGPRFGFSWTPDMGRSVIRGNAGLYYSRTPALLMVSPITTNGQAAYQLSFSPETGGAPVFPNILSGPPTGASIPRSDVNFFDPNFQNPRTLQASISAEREVFPNTTFGIDLIYSDSVNMQRMFDSNLAPPSGTEPDGRLFYGSPRPNTAFNRMLRSESTAKARYFGTVLSAKRRFTGADVWYNKGLQFQGSYTFGRAKDDDSNERNFSATFYQDWQHLDVEYTWGENDVRHNFVANATWLLGGDVQVGLITSGRTGRPYSLTSTSDINGDGTFDQDRLYVDGADSGRNAFRHPNYYRTDVRIAKRFVMSSRSAEIAFDVFNLFDNANTFVGTSNRNFLNNADAGVPNEQIGGSRQGQVSFRLDF